MITTLADFQVESLGIDTPSSFTGYGVAFSKFAFCAYGVGNTEGEALADCIEMMSQAAGFDLTEDVEKRIRDAFGEVDETTVAEALDTPGDVDEDDCGEESLFHVGIKWNEVTAGAKA